MEGYRKRSLELLKGKLMPFHKTSKPSQTVQYSIVKPSLSSASSASMGYVTHQDYVMAQPKPKVSFVGADNNSCDMVAQLEDIYGIAADESVDAKAALYIFKVQERLKLERLNSERMTLQQN